MLFLLNQVPYLLPSGNLHPVLPPLNHTLQALPVQLSLPPAFTYKAMCGCTLVVDKHIIGPHGPG